MDIILDEIKQLRKDLIQPKIIYVTMELNCDYDLIFDSIKVFTNPDKIPYLYSDCDKYFDVEDMTELEVGKTVEGYKFKIAKMLVE